MDLKEALKGFGIFFLFKEVLLEGMSMGTTIFLLMFINYILETASLEVFSKKKNLMKFCSRINH